MPLTHLHIDKQSIFTIRTIRIWLLLLEIKWQNSLQISYILLNILNPNLTSQIFLEFLTHLFLSLVFLAKFWSVDMDYWFAIKLIDRNLLKTCEKKTLKKQLRKNIWTNSECDSLTSTHKIAQKGLTYR